MFMPATTLIMIGVYGMLPRLAGPRGRLRPG